MALFQETDLQEGTAIEELDESEEGRDDKSLVCAGCLNPITRNQYRISKQGQHKHVFFNPSGLVFELGCFSTASGCFQTGQSTLEFTWFDGYAWQITLCSACNLHLGWLYRSREGDGFYGLILGALLEQSP
ncbi:MAG: hypothetical protein K9K64_11665 [Desulfohalobiaceae bacterium]|nr:hypothetical protein [Desulfohalobiaceae bacterium]